MHSLTTVTAMIITFLLSRDLMLVCSKKKWINIAAAEVNYKSRRWNFQPEQKDEDALLMLCFSASIAENAVGSSFTRRQEAHT